MMITFFLHFSCLFWTPLRRLPKERLPQKTFAQGEFLAKKFSPKETFVQERPFLPRFILSKKMSALWSHCSETFFARKGHPIGKSMWLEQTADTQKSDTLVIYSRELLTCKLRAASGTLLLKTCLCFQ